MSNSWKSSIFLIENLLSDRPRTPNSNCSSPLDRQPAKRPRFSDDDSPSHEIYQNINNNNLRMPIKRNYIYTNPLGMQGNLVYAQPITMNPMSYYMRTGAMYDVTGRKRKTRTVFTQDQTERLESCFSSHKYLCLADRLSLARELSLNEAQIKTWFQNRRTKLKKQLADTDEMYL
ncbi:BarH-like Homeodomain (HD) containing transcription factor [Oopsacas minuta]|uniref:BarH-like Homeodomain (HD) containing transcription factor n=1 Tax=Oopsacas minuta TaxID=111878 RepID=A0AAV7JU30_9METZ|nr:BarH-like Homeodomain (HD) containing transcription factor [Oopsacas minuta]